MRAAATNGDEGCDTDDLNLQEVHSPRTRRDAVSSLALLAPLSWAEEFEAILKGLALGL